MMEKFDTKRARLLSNFYHIISQKKAIIPKVDNIQNILVEICVVVFLMLFTGCTSAPISITSVKYPGCIWSPHQNNASIISQDGGQSFAVPGGSLWTFGDTFLGKRDLHGIPHFKGGAIFCSIAFLPEKDRSFPPALRYKTCPTGIANSPLSLLRGEKKGIHMLWPLGGIYVHGKSYLYYSVIQKTGTGSWDFKGIGSGLAYSKDPMGNYKRLCPNNDWQFPVEPSQIIKHGQWLYFYEIIKRDSATGAGLARVEADKIGFPEAYEYYNRTTRSFSKDKSSQSIIVPAAGQVSVVYNKYCNGWLMATSSNFFHPRRICLYFSSAPEGPWLYIDKIKTPEKFQGKKVELVYCTFMHPELFRENGKIINLTFSLHLQNSGFDANCEMAEITLKRK